jgi:hypothetical protein
MKKIPRGLQDTRTKKGTRLQDKRLKYKYKLYFYILCKEIIENKNINNSTKMLRDYFTKNIWKACRWLSEIKHLNKWRAIPYSWIGRLIIKTSIIPRFIYRFSTISNKDTL